MIRKLNKNEIKVLRSVYYDEIDYGKVSITKQHLFSYLLKKYSGIVFDNTIVFPKRTYRDDFSINTISMALLIHEMCHVWQYQNLRYRWYKAGFEHLKFRKSTYLYNIADHNKLTDFRFEQQGDIMADYYKKRLKNEADLETYEKVIYSVINT